MTAPAGRERCFGLVALGDSITAGVGDTVGPDAVHGPGWAAHLATVLGAEVFTNLATNGARSSDVAGTQLAAAAALRPRLATVLVGGNDVLRSDFDARRTLLDLHRCVSELCRAGTDVVLVQLPVIGLFELSPRLVRHVMRRRVASVNAAVEEVAAASSVHCEAPVLSSVHCEAPALSSVPCFEIGPSVDRSRSKGPNQGPRLGNQPNPARGRVIVVDAVQAIAPAGAKAWHIDRVHPSPAGHRLLALGVAIALTQLDTEYAVAVDEPVAAAVDDPVAAAVDEPVAVTVDAPVAVTVHAPVAVTVDEPIGVGQMDPGTRALAARLPQAPDPPSARHRLTWLLRAGLPWCVRRGRDFLPGLFRAVVHDLRAEQALTPDGLGLRLSGRRRHRSAVAWRR